MLDLPETRGWREVNIHNVLTSILIVVMSGIKKMEELMKSTNCLESKDGRADDKSRQNKEKTKNEIEP